MSSQPERPPRSSPPQSAQPYRSLFGGSSSQNVPDSDPPSQAWEDQGIKHYGSDDYMNGQLEYQDYSDDDATYVPSDEDTPASPKRRANSQPVLPVRKPVGVAPPTKEEDRENTPSSIQYRPNRFQGTDSTWRRLTLDDRENAMALEEARARDLAAHLYNAHALRVRAREAASYAEGKRGPLKKEELFTPPVDWAAWPMPMEDVPRANERLRRFEDDMWTLRSRPDHRDSAELEENIIASILKTAKERFRARNWSEQCPSSRGRSRQRDTDDKGGQTDEDDEDDEDIPLRPSIQSDDDKARKQLRPLARNIIEKVEHLLQGLGYALERSGSEGGAVSTESETDQESVYSRSSRSRKRRLSGYADRSVSRGRKRVRTSSWHGRSSKTRSPGAESLGESHSKAPSQSRGRSKSNRIQRGGGAVLRDWSEVVGTASVLGLPQSVIMRTAQRCAALFNEDMTFRTFAESNDFPQGSKGTVVIEQKTAGSGEHDQSVPPSKSRSQSRASSSHAASRKGKSTSRAASSAPETTDNPERPRGKGPHRKKDLVCPVRKCDRHFDGFTRQWNLNLHIKTTHPGLLAGKKKPNPQDASNPGSGNDID